MDVLMALGVSIGVLIAVWTYLAVSVVSLPVWVGIITWGAFFAAGGKTDGLVKTIAASLSGLVWAFIAITVSAKLGGGVPVLAVLVGVIAFAMVIESRVSVLSFIPGAFLGAAFDSGCRRDHRRKLAWQDRPCFGGGRGVRLRVRSVRRRAHVQEGARGGGHLA